MKKNIFVILLSTTLLTSCFWWENKKGVNINMDSNPVWANLKIEERKVETEIKNWELKVWDSVSIKKGKASDFPKYFPIIGGWEIYQNSNVQKYAFIISSKSLVDIYNFYNSSFLWNSWKASEENQVDINDENLSSIYLVFTKQKTENIIEEVTININSNIPKIIKENLVLNWNFIEVTFKDLPIE